MGNYNLEFVDTNIFESEASILVNPVNCEGVMGAGLAKEFARLFPVVNRDYTLHCKDGIYKPGNVYLYESGIRSQTKFIINLTTKNLWKNPSSYTWVELGIGNLRELLHFLPGNSVSIPALGCGLGGLNWDRVRKEFEAKLGRPIPGISRIIVHIPESHLN